MKIIFCLFFIFIAHNSYSEEQKIYLAGGCFWCLEEAFQDKKGVISAISGYSGGHTINPTYKEVSRGDTGHIEALEVIYEDKTISMNQIFNFFITYKDSALIVIPPITKLSITIKWVNILKKNIKDLIYTYYFIFIDNF